MEGEEDVEEVSLSFLFSHSLFHILFRRLVGLLLVAVRRLEKRLPLMIYEPRLTHDPVWLYLFLLPLCLSTVT